MSYHIISCHIISSYHIIAYHVISYHSISYHIISYHIISHHIISYHIISYHIISYHIISYHIISFHIMLYRTITYGLAVESAIGTYITTGISHHNRDHKCAPSSFQNSIRCLIPRNAVENIVSYRIVSYCITCFSMKFLHSSKRIQNFRTIPHLRSNIYFLPYLAVASKTLSMGTSPFEVPFVPLI